MDKFEGDAESGQHYFKEMGLRTHYLTVTSSTYINGKDMWSVVFRRVTLMKPLGLHFMVSIDYLAHLGEQLDFNR